MRAQSWSGTEVAPGRNAGREEPKKRAWAGSRLKKVRGGEKARERETLREGKARPPSRRNLQTCLGGFREQARNLPQAWYLLSPRARPEP